MDIAEYEAAGLYDPASPNAAERLELLRWFESRGLTLEEMKAANTRGQLPFAASRLLLRPGPFLTQQQLADRLAQPAELIEAFRVAFALPPLPPDAPWCNEAEARMFEAVASGVKLFGQTGMERLSRVLGASVGRIAEAMASTNIERLRQISRDGATEIEIAKANLLAIETADAPARIISGLLGIHLQLAAGRLREGRANLHDETVRCCVGFVDLAGSTTLSRTLSARELGEMVDRFEEVAHRIATNRRGRVVKFIGDEVMFVTNSANAACEIALELVEAFGDDARMKPRGGAAVGSVIDRCGDYYGPIVNLAARLGELAVPHEVLVTTELAAEITSPNLRCDAAGRRSLRGFEEPVNLMSVHRSS